MGQLIKKILTFDARIGSQGAGLLDLCNFIKEKMGNQYNIIEIGSYCGASAQIISSVFKEAKINCVDIWEKYIEECSSYDINRQGLELIEAEAIFDETISKIPNIIKNKTSSEEYNKKILDESIDFIYIDGNHQYSSILQDVTIWYPKIKKGGAICGHDVGWPSVNKALGVFFQRHPNNTFCDGSWIYIK